MTNNNFSVFVRFMAEESNTVLLCRFLSDAHAFGNFFELGNEVRIPSQGSFTYSKSRGCVLIPRSGGAIHPAIFPRSNTPCIKLRTYARSFSVGSHSVCRAPNSSALIGFPVVSVGIFAQLPTVLRNLGLGSIIRCG